MLALGACLTACDTSADEDSVLVAVADVSQMSVEARSCYGASFDEACSAAYTDPAEFAWVEGTRWRLGYAISDIARVDPNDPGSAPTRNWLAFDNPCADIVRDVVFRASLSDGTSDGWSILSVSLYPDTDPKTVNTICADGSTSDIDLFSIDGFTGRGPDGALYKEVYSGGILNTLFHESRYEYSYVTFTEDLIGFVVKDLTFPGDPNEYTFHFGFNRVR